MTYIPLSECTNDSCERCPSELEAVAHIYGYTEALCKTCAEKAESQGEAVWWDDPVRDSRQSCRPTS